MASLDLGGPILQLSDETYFLDPERGTGWFARAAGTPERRRQGWKVC